MWTQANSRPADRVNVYGINPPHIVLQPMAQAGKRMGLGAE
ncbi:MAG TPA: hypothetical protein VJ690_07870 [Burkholderiales bacterium]|nr:hypothetical protein [Burkholderiales bacterium]